MTTTRAFLFIFVLFASLNPFLSFASRGLYFSVSKMTSSQKNAISDYKQGTEVDVQLLNLPQSNVVSNAEIDGKAFDFTTSNTAGSGYLSYDKLKSALHGKVMTGDVTFKVMTSALDKSITTYTVGAASGSTAAGSLTLNGANVTLIGTTAGTSSLTTTPTTGGTMTYTIDEGSPVTVPSSTPISSIVVPNLQYVNVCIYDATSSTEVCAPRSYIDDRYGVLNQSEGIRFQHLLDEVRSTPITPTIRDGVITVYQVPTSYRKIDKTVQEDPIKNTISTTTNGADITFGKGAVVSVTNGVVNSFNAQQSIDIAGSTTTTTEFACIDSAPKSTGDPGRCDVQVDTAGRFYFAQFGSPLINSNPNSQKITTTGSTTFINATLGNEKNSFTSVVTSGNVTMATANPEDSGIDLYSPLFDQTRYISTPFLSIAQNIRLAPEKIGSNLSISDLTLTFSKDISSSPIANNSANAIQYIDGDDNNPHRGLDAISKIAAAYSAAASTDVGQNIQSYAAVGDVNYTANTISNLFAKAGVVCSTTNCGFGVDSTSWNNNTAFTQILSYVQNLSAVQNTANIFLDALNSALDDSKANNLASYQANYVKGSGTDKVDEYGYKLDGSDKKVKDGTYNVTLRAKDWSFETQRVKDLVISDVSSRSLAPQFSTQSQMQNFVSALSGQSSSGFEMSVGYKFRMFKSAFYAAPQLDISMFRNNSSTISGKDQTPKTSDAKKYTYGSLDSSYAGSLVAKFGFENKLNLGIFRTPFSVYGFGGGTSGLTTYRSANSQSFGLKYGVGAEIFVSKQLAIFGEMFWINFLKQNINYATTASYDFANNSSDTVGSYINSQTGTTVTLDNAQYGADTKNLSIKYADFNQVIDTSSIKYTTNESFANTSSIQGVKFGLTYYVE